MAKRKKIEDYKLIDGKNDSEVTIPTRKGNIHSLDELVGGRMSKLDTTDPVEYKERITQMGVASLQNECIKHNIYPNDNVVVMRNRLMENFKNKIALLRKDIPEVVNLKAPNARKIMAHAAQRAS